MDRLEAAKYIKDHCLGSEVYRDGTTWNDAMVTAVEVLEGKDTNVPTNSALDHIHNVVRDDAYRRGYEQGKADANHPEIPDSWIPMSERLPLKEFEERVSYNAVFPCLVTMYGTVQKRYFDGADFIDVYGDACTGWVKAWKPLPEPWKGGIR